jgi:hypothetical protein
MTARRRSLGMALGLFAVLALPPVAQALQARMQLQMLVQIPLLAVAGYLFRAALSGRWQERIHAWNPVGINGLIVATFVLSFWMLPRSMDAAVSDWLFTVAKFITVPLLVGLPMGLSWPRMNFIMRGVVSMELIAMCWRLGWLYLASPVRLCNNYLIDDQQLTGRYLLAAGVALLAWIALQLLFGHVRVPGGDVPEEGVSRHAV